MIKTSQYERVGADFYQEPRWVTEGLLRVERPFIGSVFDPCCGDGNILNALDRNNILASGLDIRDEAYNMIEMPSDMPRDFRDSIPLMHYKSIISNPPYSNKQPEELILLALEHITDRLCLFLRASFWTSGAGRWGKNGILRNTPLARIWTFDKRPSCAPLGVKLKGSGTTDFVWMVWEKGYRGLPQTGTIYKDGCEYEGI